MTRLVTGAAVVAGLLLAAPPAAAQGPDPAELRAQEVFARVMSPTPARRWRPPPN